MTPATGWAVAKDGEIMIRSVMDTQVAAAANWIIRDGGGVIAQGTADEVILEFFAVNAPAGTVLVPVIVSLKLDG